MQEIRNSGARIHRQCVLKKMSGARLEQEVAIMLAYPEVFCHIWAHGRTEDNDYFAVMPQYDAYSEKVGAWGLRSALERLEVLWGPDSQKTVSGYRQVYHDFILSLDVPGYLRAACGTAYMRIWGAPGTAARFLHGDATLQNTVYHNGEAFWIDPSPRHAPLEREVDIAKMLVSVRGYDPTSAELKKLFHEFLDKSAFNRELIEYYFLTHLARIWGQQKDWRDWTLNFVSGGLW